MREIKTNQLKNRKHPTIDGHKYTVRRMGNAEQLNMSQYIRRMNEIAELESSRALTDEETKEGEDITKKISDLFLGLFDDGGDQSKSRALVDSLTFEDIGEVLGQVFEEPDKSEDGSAKTPTS